MSLHEYNDMTPLELALSIDQYQKRELYQHRERITAAYVGAYLQRAKRMPKLDKLLGQDPEKKKPMTDKQMLNMIRSLNRKMGGKEVGK